MKTTTVTVDLVIQAKINLVGHHAHELNDEFIKGMLISLDLINELELHSRSAMVGAFKKCGLLSEDERWLPSAKAQFVQVGIVEND